MGIIIDNKNTVSLKTVKDGEVREVDKVITLEPEVVDGDLVDFSQTIRTTDGIDMGGWFIIADDYSGGYYYLKHNDTELTWQKERPELVDGGRFPDNILWHFVPNEDGETYTMESRDGYRPQTNSGTSASTHIKVTTGETGLSKVKLEQYKSTCLKITDYATVTGGKSLNNAYGYGTYGIWWNDPSELIAWEVTSAGEIMVFHERVWYYNPIYMIKGTSTATEPFMLKINGTDRAVNLNPNTGNWKLNIKPYLPLTSLKDFAKSLPITSISLPTTFDTSRVSDMSHAFYGTNLSDISFFNGFDFGNTTTVEEIFRDCKNLTGSISVTDSFFQPKLKQIYGLFDGCNYSEIDLTNWDLANTAITDLKGVLPRMITDIDLSGMDGRKITGLENLFMDKPNLKTITFTEGFVTAKCTKLQAVFRQSPNIEELDLSTWDTSNVTNMSYLFSGYNVTPKLKRLNLNGWVFKKVSGNTLTNNNDNGWIYKQNALTDLTINGGEIWQSISFLGCPNINLNSAVSILNALQDVGATTQTLTFSASTLALINADTETLILCARAKKLGWDIPGIALPDYLFTINQGETVEGANVAKFGTTEPVTTYEANTLYYVLNTASPNLDFSGRGVDGGMQIDRGIINLNLSNNPNLSKLIFTRDDVEGTLWINGTGINIKTVIDKFYSLLSPRTLKVYYDKSFDFDGKRYTPTTEEFNDNYVVFGFGRFDTPRVEEMNNYTAEDVIFEIGIDQDYTENGWVASTYDRPAGTDGWEYWMSNSNYHVNNGISKIRLKVSSSAEKEVEIYINSYGESDYDFTRAYALDSTSTIILDTKSYQKTPEGDLSTNWKKVTYTIPGDGETHYIYLDYKKDGSGNNSYDRGFIIFNPEQ